MVDVDVTVPGREGTRGTVLGKASSRTIKHRHPTGQAPPPYQRCSACRWTELTILRLEDGRYAVLSEGHSALKGEMTYRRFRRHDSAESVLASLYREDTRSGNDPEPILSVVGKRALIEAAVQDRSIDAVLRTEGILG